MFNLFKKNNEVKSEIKEDEDISPIADYIISESGLNNLPKNDLTVLRDGLIMQINRRIGLIIIDNLNEAALEEYNKLLGESLVPDPKKLELFLQANIVDCSEKIKMGLDEFVNQAIASFKK